KLLKGIDNLLNAQFSENQIKEAEKAKSALQDIKDDITWNIIKMAAVFTLSVAAAMITGGLAGVAAGRVCSALVMGIRTTNIVKFAASNIGMAAGVTVGQRGATHAVNLLPGTEWEVDWSAKSMAMDFGRNIALSVGFTGGGALLGKELAKRAVIKTGGKYTYAELTEAGLTKFGFIQRITSPIKITEDFVKEGIKGAFKKSTAKFLEEVAQETMEEMAESIHPVLGGIASMANAATGGPNIDINIKQRFGKKLQEIGVQLNESTRRLEFQQNSASDFGADLMAHLGDARHEVEFSVNQDNTFSLRIMGTDQTITIHQSEEITAQQQIGRLSEESKWYREQGVKNTETEERIGVLESEIEEELKGLKTNTDEYHEKHFEILNRRLRENKEKNRDNPKELIQGYKDIQRVIGKNYPKKLKQLQSDFYGARLELSKSTIQQIQEGTIETTKAKSILKKSNVKVESGETEQMAIKRWLEQKNTAIEEQKAILRGIVDPEIEQMIMLGHLYGHISRAEINLDSHLQHRQKLLQTTKQLSSNSETQTLLKKHASQLMEHIDSRSHPLSTDQKILIQKLTNDLVDTAAQTEMSVDQATQLVEDTVEKLIYQTVETTKRQLGDHGIRHISGNIKVADQLMQKLESAGHKFTKQDKLLMMVTHINHDMGYTVGLGRFGFDGTKLHDLTGEMIIDNQRESFEGILSPERFAQMQRLIRDHDGTEMIFDSENTMDTLGSVVRISDNMALFANEKLPEVFARDMQALKILGLIQLARDSKIDERSTIVQELKENLRGIIINKRREGEISRAEEINLTKAVDEIFHSSGKFTLGMTGGRYGGDLFQVGIGEDGKTIIDIRLEKSESQKTLSETFEKEQKLEAVQFLKMVNDYRQEFGLEKIDLEEFQRMSDTKEGLVIDTGQGIMRIKVRETASKETKSSDTLRKRGSEIQKELSDLRPKIQEDPANKSLMNKYEQLLVERSQIYETIAMREVRYAGDEYFKIVKGANGLHTQEIESMSQMTQEKFVQMGPEQKAEIAEKLKHFMRAINAGPKGLQGISIQKIMRQGLGIDPASGNVIEAGNYEVFKTEIDEVLNIQSHLNGYLLKDLAKRTLS
ncbi:hypothetical protein KKG51_04055, partial [Patescibacteria group bacterium]|nr:hypothetical protein [Patescibacteria group bacterium]